jgi:RNA polymerase sigma factor (sigma-70 family)
MPMTEVTRILSAIEQGDPRAAEQLLPLVYDELRKLAAHRMAQEAPDHTLQATALVHEAYIRLVASPLKASPLEASPLRKQGEQPLWNSRGHFFAAAAEAMRRILVETARKRGRLKRGGDRQRINLDAVELSIQEVPDNLLALDEALTELAETHPEKAELVKLRYFAGLTVHDAAQTLGIAPSTADRHWTYARAWLYRRIVGDAQL